MLLFCTDSIGGFGAADFRVVEGTSSTFAPRGVAGVVMSGVGVSGVGMTGACVRGVVRGRSADAKVRTGLGGMREAWVCLNGDRVGCAGASSQPMRSLEAISAFSRLRSLSERRAAFRPGVRRVLSF